MSSEGQNNLDLALKTRGNDEIRLIDASAATTYTLNAYDRNVEVKMTSAIAAVVKMPPLGEVEDGAIFNGYIRNTGGGGAAITLKSAGDCADDDGTPADIIGDDFTAAKDCWSIQRTGRKWAVLADVST